MDFVVSLASDRIILALDTQICIIWISMRPTGVWMVTVVQDYGFLGQHLLQFGIRLGYLTVVSRVPCARVLRCVTRYEGGDSSIIDYFSSIDNREVISGF